MNYLPGLRLENIFLIILSFVLILIIDRKTKSESAVLFVGILAFHHVVAYLYAFSLSLPQNEVDPKGFLSLANDCTNFGRCGYLGMYLYANYLSKMLALGSSIYFVFLLNVLFFVISLYFFIKIAELFFQKDNRKVFILFYGLWPSVIFYTTLNYREPFELYLLVVASYLALSGSKTDNFLSMFFSMILLLSMGMFHIKGLIFLSPVLFIILVSYRFSFTLQSFLKRFIILTIMVIPVLLSQGMYAGYLSDLSRSTSLSMAERVAVQGGIESKKPRKKARSPEAILFEKNKEIFYNERRYPSTEPDFIESFMRKVKYYRVSLFWVRAPRTAFYSKINDESLPSFIATYSLVYIEYLFAPFIVQVNSLLSLLAYFESVLRLILFTSAIFLLRRRPDTAILLILYLAITAMWSIGVVSYGASIRHHTQTNWILVLLGIPVLSGYIRAKFQATRPKAEI